MKKLVTLLMVVTVLTNSTVALSADCTPAIDLAVGDKVTDCPRVGIRPDVAKKMQLDLIEKDFTEKELAETKKVVTLKDLALSNQEKQTELWKADAQREREAYDKERSRTDKTFWVGMGAGILTILAGAWAVKQVAK